MSDVLNGERWRVDEGDCLTWLRGLPDGFAQCCVTSPPYWGLRDYGEPGQLGLEPTPEEFVANMVAVFGEVRRVLREDGVLWLNIGDSYAHDNPSGPQGSRGDRASRTFTAAGAGGKSHGLKPKDLCMIPARLALALQADGWYLRSDVIWYKPNPMPESVTDRPTSAHEHVFLLAKSERYFFDAFAVREAAVRPGDTQTFGGEKGRNYTPEATDPNFRNGHEQWGRTVTSGQTRNLRNVWEIPTQGTPEAHFATYPEALVEPCIKAGSSDRACSECGAAWQRVVTKTRTFESGSGRSGNMPVGKHGEYLQGGGETLDIRRGPCLHVETTSFVPDCICGYKETTGSIVIDPFTGSGTTGRVALRLGRRFLGCELNPQYAAMSRRRIASYHVKPVRPRQADDDRQTALFEVPA